MIEQTNQEALRVREENRVVESTKAHRRGMLLLEEAKIFIQRLENDPQLLEPIRITPHDTINIGEEINGLESTPLEGTVDPENPIVPSPQATSSVIIPSQQDITRTSSETGVTNILFDLITIYDDEEISKVFLITLVPVIEEK